MPDYTLEQLSAIGNVLPLPAYLFRKGTLLALNPEAGSISLQAEDAASHLPPDGDTLLPVEIQTDPENENSVCLLAGKRISLDGEDCWLLQAVCPGKNTAIQNIHRVSAARQIMLHVSSKIESLETTQDVYDFILDSCGKAVEHARLCTLMVVEEGKVRIVAKRGFQDDVLGMVFDLQDVFISIATQGKIDRIVTINDLGGYMSRYHKEAKTEDSGKYLGSTLSAPIYVDGRLYAIMNFDSVEKDGFTKDDEELLYVVKTNIEFILANHRMHREILRMSRHDLLTGLYNRTYLQEFLKRHFHEKFLVGFFDLNHLKTTNDRYGHVFGDALIRAFAENVPDVFPEGTAFFRIGGDEFTCAVFQMEMEEARGRIAYLREKLKEEPIALPCGDSIGLSFSCGFAVHEPDASWSIAAQEADLEMYEEKRRQKSCE